MLVKTLTDEAADLIRHSLSENTERAYRGDLAHFRYWDGVIPATPVMTCAYVGDYAGKPRRGDYPPPRLDRFQAT